VTASVWCVIPMFVLAPWYEFVMSATMGRTRDAAPSVEGLESLMLTTVKNALSVRKM